jgi:cyclopropane fatty-acyl-phospholipid synthase-like methyltransferase
MHVMSPIGPTIATNRSAQLRQQVRRYFDDHSTVFERFGQGRSTIHRAVWGEGVGSREEAFGYVDRLIAERAVALGDPAIRLLDLGCGLGASLIRLAGLLPRATGVGVTLSPRQAARARELVAGATLGTRVRCLEADYLELADDLGTFDLAFAIEAFVHTPNAAAFFASVARRLRPGGQLIICDDFQSRAARGAGEERWLELIRRGWAVNTLSSPTAASELARQSGFALVEDRDLTAQLELRRPRDRLISALLVMGRPFRPTSTLWGSWMGGDALQRALVARLVEYHFMVFEQR